MTVSEAKTFGFLVALVALLTKAHDLLKAAGLDVDKMIAVLQKLQADAAAANATQEEAKRKQRASTEAFVALKRQSYVTASGFLDMAIGAVGKDTDAAANFRRMRSDMDRDRQERPDGSEEPLPVPPAKA